MVKFSKQFDSGKNFRKISVFSQIFDFSENSKNLNLVKFSKISIFSQISKNFDFSQNFGKISIFFENFDAGQILEIIRFWSKLPKNLDFFANFEKFPF